MERVSLETGSSDSNVLVVCPHAPDYTNLDLIVKSIQKNLNCYSLLNNGFKKSEHVDSLNDLGDCNRIDHLLNNNAMKSEFLIPLTKSVNSMLMNHQNCYVFYIHGFSGKVHQIDEGEIDLDIVIGGGVGKRHSSLSCEDWQRAIFHDNIFKGLLAYGNAFRIATAIDGKFGAKRNINMCQYYRHYLKNYRVQSLQIEIASSVRKTNELAIRTGDWLTNSIKNSLNDIKEITIDGVFNHSVSDTEEFLFDYT